VNGQTARACAGSKGICPDRQPVAAAGTGDEAFQLERFQSRGDGLTGGADGLGKKFVRERQFDFDTTIDRGAVRTGELQEFRPQSFSVPDVPKLGEALLALAKLIEQGVDDYLGRGWDLKQRSFDVCSDRDHGGVGERDELLIVSERGEERARRAEAEHDPPPRPATGRNHDDSGFHDQQRRWGKVADAMDGADAEPATRTA
jgi:hypothetical protein